MLQAPEQEAACQKAAGSSKAVKVTGFVEETLRVNFARWPGVKLTGIITNGRLQGGNVTSHDTKSEV